jgi:hypothetical protein
VTFVLQIFNCEIFLPLGVTKPIQTIFSKISAVRSAGHCIATITRNFDKSVSFGMLFIHVQIKATKLYDLF